MRKLNLRAVSVVFAAHAPLTCPEYWYIYFKFFPLRICAAAVISPPEICVSPLNFVVTGLQVMKRCSSDLAVAIRNSYFLLSVSLDIPQIRAALVLVKSDKMSNIQVDLANIILIDINRCVHMGQ